MSGQIVVGTEALEALAGRMDAAAATARSATALDASGAGDAVSAALTAFDRTWHDRREEIATQLRNLAGGARQVACDAQAIDAAGVAALRGR